MSVSFFPPAGTSSPWTALHQALKEVERFSASKIDVLESLRRIQIRYQSPGVALPDIPHGRTVILPFPGNDNNMNNFSA